MDKFLPLKADIKQEVERFKKLHFRKYNIGIQKRTGGWGDPNPVPSIPLDFLLQTAHTLEVGAPFPPEDVAFFVSSYDIPEVNSSRAIHGEDKILYYYGSQQRATKLGDRVAFITMWLLGECDDVIAQEPSSFALNAAARGGVVPVVCNHERFCMRKLTPQPCSSFPFTMIPVCKTPSTPTKIQDFNQYPSVEGSCRFFANYMGSCLKY